MVDYPDDFTDYPETLAATRADRGDDGATLWTPRDLLIRMLKDIDSGELEVDTLIVCFEISPKTEDDTGRLGYKQYTKTGLFSIVGVMEGVKAMMFAR